VNTTTENTHGKRHHGLDAVRGVCALAVVLFHYFSWTGIAEYNSLGMYGVYVFFILSSTTLVLVYGDRFSRGISAAALNDYFLHRFARIFPLLAVVSIAYFGFEILVQDKPWYYVTGFLFTLTGLFALQSPGYMASAPGTWSLGVEILFYLLFPCLLLYLNGRRLLTVLLLALAALVAQQLAINTVLRSGTLVNQWPLFSLFVSFLFYFTAGFCVPRIQLRKSVTHLFLGFLLVLVPVGLSLVSDISPERLVAWPLGTVFPLLIGAGIVLIFNGAVPRILVRVFEFLGLISYSSYLLHPFVWEAVKHLPQGLPAFAIFSIFLIGTLLTSYLCFRFFENPARTAIRKVFR
jgi:exopolysaccharide production protein ExoZ